MQQTCKGKQTAHFLKWNPYLLHPWPQVHHKVNSFVIKIIHMIFWMFLISIFQTPIYYIFQVNRVNYFGFFSVCIMDACVCLCVCSTCAHVGVCTGAHGCMWVHMYTWIEDKGQHQMSSSNTPHLIFWGRVSYWANRFSEAGKSVNPGILLTLPAPSTRSQKCTAMLAFKFAPQAFYPLSHFPGP